jgi:hypothetical protein
MRVVDLVDHSGTPSFAPPIAMPATDYQRVPGQSQGPMGMLFSLRIPVCALRCLTAKCRDLKVLTQINRSIQWLRVSLETQHYLP